MTSKFRFLHDESRQYLGSVSLFYKSPITTDNNDFIARAYDGVDGLEFNANVFIYKNLYLGLNYGISNFEIRNSALVGNYTAIKIEERYITVGYEFLPFKQVRLGIFTAVYGEATLTNTIEGGFSNRDSGNFWNYGLRLEYEFIKNLNVMVSYDWRRIKTNISTSSDIAPFFEKGTYNILSFGLKFNFSNADLVDKWVF